MDRLRLHWHAWVVACDGAKALLLRNDGDEIQINLQVFEKLEQHHAQTHELGTDRPGRVQESASPGRSALAETDWHDRAETDFLHRLADRLEELVEAKTLRQFVLVASPKAMGKLREMLSPPVKAAIKQEIEKDLVNEPVYRIEKHFAG